MSLDLSSGMGEAATSTIVRGERRRATSIADATTDDGVASAARVISPVRFVDTETKERLSRDAAASRAIVLRPRADAPGTLANGIDGDLESALALRGALPSGLADGASLEDRLRDQLNRATCLPVRGVCLALPPMGACVEADGVLADVDARYLGAWLRAVVARPVPISILFDERDRSMLARVPRSLDDVVRDLAEELAPAAAELAPPPSVASAPTDDIAPSTGVLVETSDDDEDTSYYGDEEGLGIPDLIAMSAAEVRVDADVDDESGWDEAIEAAPVTSAEPAPAVDATAVIEEAGAEERDAHGEPSEVEVEVEPESAPPHEAADGARPMKSLAEAMAETLRPSCDVPVHAKAPDVADEERAERLLHAAEWRAHAVELDAARGPKPVSAIERLFVQRYLPLLGALMRNEVDYAVSSIIEQWAQAFAESYTDAYPALRVTGKRPTMVLDAFDVASRIARLSSARSVKLVLVDSMSFDLAERVASRMKTALDKRAVLVERTTLWSALPTTTPTQMQLLARGPEALRESAPVSSSEPDVTRGRNIATLRRERVGSRELMKLDLVEARLRGPGAAYDERLDAIAGEVSDVLMKLMETLPPRTLLYVFGDHGFVLGVGANGWATGGATQGGASPEEVLVAGHAWLVDAMQ